MPLYQSFESFYTRNLYRRIRDCWNRPICSVPGAHFDLMDRESDDHGWTFRFTGSKTRALNLGSYNYLGYAQNEGLCADDAVVATQQYGCGVGSTRHELGKELFIIVLRIFAHLKLLKNSVLIFMVYVHHILCISFFGTQMRHLSLVIYRKFSS